MQGAAGGSGDQRVAYRPIASDEELRSLEVALHDELQALEEAEARLSALTADPRLEKRLRRAPLPERVRAEPLPDAPLAAANLRPRRSDAARYESLTAEIATLPLPQNASDLAWLHGRLTGLGRAPFRTTPAELRGALRSLEAPTPSEVPRELDRILTWSQQPGHPALVATFLAGEVLAIRPFKQSDRLLSQLLMRLVLQKNGMGSIGHLVLDRRVDLAASDAVDRLIGAVAGAGPAPWATAALRDLREAVESAVSDAQLARCYLDSLNERQWRVAEWFRHAHAQDAGMSWRFREIHAAFPSVPPRTLKRDLATLREIDILHMEGKLKSARYVYKPEPAAAPVQDKTA